MPEQSKRIVLLGVKKAEADFTRYVRQRLAAERSTDVLAQELVDLERQAVELERVVGSAAPGRTPSFSDLGQIDAALDRALGGL